jgi:low affinity Fe/Cu permease
MEQLEGGRVMVMEAIDQRKSLQAMFSRVAKDCAVAMGHPWAFLFACAVIVAWALTGPLFGYSDTWQLVINTGTTIITFLMVFLIQNTQNRDSCAIQVKLDELLRSTRGAHNALLDLEELTQAELDEFLKNYQLLAQEARKRVRQGMQDVGTPDVKKAASAKC